MIPTKTIVGVSADGGTASSTAFTGTVRMSRGSPEAVHAEQPTEASGSRIESEDVYRVYFHGPAYQVLDSAWLLVRVPPSVDSKDLEVRVLLVTRWPFRLVVLDEQRSRRIPEVALQRSQ